MLSFENFYQLNETPDTVNNELPNGVEVSLNWKESNAYAFGFFNPDPQIDIGNLRGKLVMQEDDATGFDKTHSFVFRRFLEIHKRQDLRKHFEESDVRQILKPSGRIWLAVMVKGKPINVISFWCAPNEVKSHHIKEIMNWFVMGEEDSPNTFLEFLGKSQSLIPVTEFEEPTEEVKLSKREKEKLQMQAAQKHLMSGSHKNPHFGSSKQSSDAVRAGERSFAEYRNKLDPSGFHGESYIA